MTLHNIFKPDLIVILGVFFVPIPSNQHFIWPLSWCLLADFCNHTWIPECGRDELAQQFRVFTDECDLFEFNCDNDLDFEIVNYSDCFSNKQPCQTAMPCPSKPTCPDHRFHRAGQHYVFVTAAARRMMRISPETPTPADLADLPEVPSSYRHRHKHHFKRKSKKKRKRKTTKHKTNRETKIYSGLHNNYKHKPHYDMPLLKQQRFGSTIGNVYIQKRDSSRLLLDRSFSQGLPLKQILNLLKPTKGHTVSGELQRIYARAHKHTIVGRIAETSGAESLVSSTPIIPKIAPTRTSAFPTIATEAAMIPRAAAISSEPGPTTEMYDLSTISTAGDIVTTETTSATEATNPTRTINKKPLYVPSIHEQQNTITTTKHPTTASDPSVHSVILKKEVVMRFGKKMLKVVKGFWRDSQKTNKSDKIK